MTPERLEKIEAEWKGDHTEAGVVIEDLISALRVAWALRDAAKAELGQWMAVSGLLHDWFMGKLDDRKLEAECRRLWS